MKLQRTFIVLFIFLFTNVYISTHAQTVNTQYGPVTGQTNGGIQSFLGIPYAAPPTGNLRWKPTEAPTTWSTPLLAQNFPPSCPQKRYDQGDTTYTLEGNEDCLYLNIWTPNITGNLPVMVFIHGGGNQQGSSGQQTGGTTLYDGTNLADRGNVVVVTIQYRLGPLGFLVHPGLEAENGNGTAGNYAVMDQLFALEWIQNNIQQFGGSTTNITIFGESAGGLNVGNLLLTPAANGLFEKAIIQSAVPLLGDYNSVQSDGISFVNDFISSGTDASKIAYMRTLPADSLTITESNVTQGGILQLGWRPVIDGQLFTQTPDNAFQSGNFNHTPLIIGSNEEEMSLTVPPVVTPGMVNLLIATSIPGPFQAAALNLYPPGNTNAEAKISYIGLLTDGQFTATTRRTARCISMNQNVPVYRYFFTQQHSFAPLQPYGSYHGMELFYVFNNWENATAGTGPLFAPSDDSTQQAFLNYWVNFAYTANPNSGNGWSNWPFYDAGVDNYLEIKATPNGTQQGIRTAKCDFWDQVINYTGCSSSIGLNEVAISEWNVYPNPATGFISIVGTAETSFELLDAMGKVLRTGNGNTLSLDGLSNGMYRLNLKTEDGIVQKSFVKAD